MNDLIYKEIDNIYNEVVSIRRYLHENPEVGFEVPNTIKYIKEKLIEFGINPMSCGTGIIAYIGFGDKTILFRSDIDALEMKEDTSLEFKSKNNCMHACGHDLHCAILLGVSKILKKYEDKLTKKVKLMFQPAEEILSGAKEMISYGVLDDVVEAYTIHVLSASSYETGTIILPKIEVSAPSSDFFEIILKGKKTHGAMPEKGCDVIIPASHVVLALDSLQSKEKSISEEALITISSINAGKTYNVISDKVTIKGSMRTFNEEIRNKFKTRIKEIVDGINKSFRCDGKVDYVSGCPTLINSPELFEKVCNILNKKYQKNIIVNNSEKSSGSEDFSYISKEVPALLIALSAGSVSSGYKYPLHNPKVVFDEEALKHGMEILLLIAFNRQYDN